MTDESWVRSTGDSGNNMPRVKSQDLQEDVLFSSPSDCELRKLAGLYFVSSQLYMHR